ncbi:uncharacterized protein LOC108682709 isoform X2 [Hyalella azteca]|uniref:Centromere protein L n=1 Tax=Hyalella azteca TaxID=294128 RepID=A0A8B7PPQ5_HYAAZ|nr:uncharacterized protein LOC108682709 isoform X2 [Hyalella azteca]
MPPKKNIRSSAFSKTKGTSMGTKKSQPKARARTASAPSGPYVSTPIRDTNVGPVVAPRKILSDDDSVPRKRSLPPTSSTQTLRGLSKSGSSKSPTSKVLQPSLQGNARRSPGTTAASSGRVTPVSPGQVRNTSLGSGSAFKKPSYRHSLRRSLYVPPSSHRRHSARLSSGEASSVLPAPEATISQSTPAASVLFTSVVDASSAKRPRLATPHLHGGAGHRTTPFKAQCPKVAHRPLQQIPAPEYSKEQISAWDSEIKTWLNKTWKLAYLSAMSGFDVHVPNLRSSYQKTLRNKISELLPFNVQVELLPVHCFSRNLSITDAVSLTISYSLPREWDLRSPSRKRKKKETQEATDNRRILYKSFMVQAQLKDRSADTAGINWYPLYFYVGRERIHQAVELWLADSFGAYVSQKGLKASALLWASGLWYQQSCADPNFPVSLSYAIVGLSADGWQHHRRYPSSSKVRDESFVSLEMPADTMKKIATCIFSESDEAQVTGSERDLFHCLVGKIIAQMTHLPASCLRLLSIKTSCVTLFRSGQVRVSCKRHLLGLLQWLLELHREDSLLDQIGDMNLTRLLEDEEITF